MRLPAGASTSVSARRRAAINSRLSMTEAVKDAVIDHRSGARAPGGAGGDLVEFGGVIAHEFEGVAALDELRPWAIRRSSSTDLTSEPSCSDWPLRCACSLVSSVAFDAVELAVEQVDERPQQIGEIVLKAGAGQHRAQGLDRRRPTGRGWRQARATDADRVRPGRGDGRTAPARRADARSVTRRGISGSVSPSGKGKVLWLRDMAWAFLAGGSAAPIAAFTAIPLPEAETVSDPQGRSAAEDGSRATILFRDAKPPLRSKIIARSAINEKPWGGGGK